MFKKLFGSKKKSNYGKDGPNSLKIAREGYKRDQKKTNDELKKVRDEYKKKERDA